MQPERKQPKMTAPIAVPPGGRLGYARARLRSRQRTPLPRAAESYEELRAKFRWKVPARDNIGVDIRDKWAGGADRIMF